MATMPNGRSHSVNDVAGFFVFSIDRGLEWLISSASAYAAKATVPGVRGSNLPRWRLPRS